MNYKNSLETINSYDEKRLESFFDRVGSTQGVVGLCCRYLFEQIKLLRSENESLKRKIDDLRRDVEYKFY